MPDTLRERIAQALPDEHLDEYTPEQLADRILPLVEQAIREEREQSETLRTMHARKQGAADGFQVGWHAALTRTQGEHGEPEDLGALIPNPLPQLYDRLERAESALAEKDAQIAALQERLDYLQQQMPNQVRHHMAARLRETPAPQTPRHADDGEL